MIKFIELFCGIGGFRLGFEMQKEFECVLSNDIDKYCKKTYDINFNQKLYLKNIEELKSNDIPDFDILTAGFPCQPFSIAGYQKGFNDNRGNLFFEIIRILRDKNPKCFLLENVKNLKIHDKSNTLKIIIDELKNLNYYVKYEILNSMEHCNIPQNRERIYIVGFLNENHFKEFKFPEKVNLTKTIKSCLENNIDEKYYYNGKPLYIKLKDVVTNKDTIYQYRRTYVRENKKNVCPTLVASMGTGGHNVPIIIDNKGIRKLTPKECANFQGFPKKYKFPEIADTHIYKQIGNSVTVPIISKIAENLRILY